MRVLFAHIVRKCSELPKSGSFCGLLSYWSKISIRHLKRIFFYRVPENFYLAPLDVRHAEEVFSCYFTRARDSFTLFSKCFSLLPSVGVFKIDKHPVILSENLESPGDKKDGELVSWLGLGYSGEIAYAYTKEKYWGFRLNRATTIYMSHKLQQHNHFCYGLVDKGNKYVVENLTSGGYLILGEAKTLFYCPEDYNVSEAFI